jgi:hypothetical protein
MDEYRERPPAAGHTRALRLIFEYAGDEVRLVSRQRIDKALPAEDPSDSPAGRAGYWVELRNADGESVHRQVLHEPIQQDVEVFSAGPEPSLARVPVERASGTFFVLVPDLEQAEELAVVRSFPDSPGLRAAPTDLVRVPLRGEDAETWR